MPVFSRLPLTRNAVSITGGNPAVRIGLAVLFAVSALSMTPAPPPMTWLPDALDAAISDNSAL